MHGANPIRPPLKGDGTTFEIQAIFRTFQGEGPLVGTPAVFIRLGGCNLACSFCDTEFESFQKWNVKDILEKTQNLAGKTARLAVITGGEPMRQPIETLCSLLLEAGFDVQIETNGTLFRPLDPRVQIVCSPKNTGKGYQPIRKDLLPHITALKFIISQQNQEYSAIAEVGQSAHNIPVYLQPMDEQDTKKNAANQNLALELVHEHGAHLSLQTHKIVGAP